MAYYKSLREYLEALDKAGKLIKITTPVNKDTQIHPLLYLQYRGLPKEQHKAFLFTNIFDSRGKKYAIPGTWGALGASSAIALKCQPEEIFDKALQALLHPLEPRLVKQGPVQEVVYMGDRLLEKGGMDEFPVAIRHPGRDAGPIQSTSNWVSKDLDTGIRNVGRYRSQVYAQDRLGIHLAGPARHLTIHWQKARAKGVPLQTAIVVGGPPNIIFGYAPPYGVDEYGIAGAMVGEPVEMVKCKTIDLEVPANADVVIEGEMNTEWLELEGPHGEGNGLMSGTELQPYLTIKCITHRKDPIWVGSLSHLGEGAGGGMGQAFLFKHLKYDLKLSGVLEVGSGVIKIKKGTDQKEVWRALEGSVVGEGPKMVVAVDEDINIDDDDWVQWAVRTRAQPHRDYRIVKHITEDLKPSSFMPEDEMIKVRHRQFDPNVKLPEASCLLINATMKWPYPPLTLPTKEFMEGALALWQELGLPPLKLKEPWYSYEMGHWPKEYAEAAERAVKGEYFKTSEMRAKNRVKVDYPPGAYTPKEGR